MIKKNILLNKLPKSFYIRNELTVARELLGKIFVRKINGVELTGKIVEIEAYNGQMDEASHAYIGKTERNKVMFLPGGLLYVYFTYGMYFCSNVVTGKENKGNAVLLRAIEPLDNIELMAKNRFGKTKISEKEKRNLTNGPGKLCIALNIAREQNGTDLTGNEIFICDNDSVKESDIVTSKRIGIKKSVDLPWRFYIKDNPYISKK